jgi:predicted MPP superfamily phosphohydrolase
MRFRDLAILTGVAGIGMFAYGYLVGRHQLTLERRVLRLPGLPERLDGFRIAVLADLHIHDVESAELSARAVALALAEDPDVVVIVGDFVQHWSPSVPKLLGDVLEPLLLMNGAVVAVPGNHDYDDGDASLLEPICDVLNIKLLRNAAWDHLGISWVGVDSYSAGKSDAALAMSQRGEEPCIAIWHEPDAADILPEGALLQISGHSHGGQFVLPGGITPKRTFMGRKYFSGFYPHAKTPVYVSRGIGTTFLPSRFNCPPEVSLLTLKALS